MDRWQSITKKVLPGIFTGCMLYAGAVWKGDILVADVEKLENLDASEIHARRFNAKEVVAPRKGQEEFVFPFADGSVKLAGGD